MTISLDQLIGLRVKTRMGQVLGRIKSLEIDSETGSISQYLITDGGWLPRILNQDILINRSQVVEITKEEMIVEDSLVGTKEILKESAT